MTPRGHSLPNSDSIPGLVPFKMDPEYKKLHEEFVSNSNGTTPEEIVFISCSIPLSLLIVEFTAKIVNCDKSSFRLSPKSALND